MDKELLKQYNEIKNKTLTTSEVTEGSFSNALSALKGDEYIGIKKSIGSRAIETSSENKLLVKTFLKENVYFLMKFESPDITFPIVEKAYRTKNKDLLENFNEIITKQLIDGWKYIVSTPLRFSYDLLLEVNGIIAEQQALEWGVLRSGKVGVNGTTYEPSIPTKESVNKILNTTDSDVYVRAMKILIRLIKAQIFWDGNKRTSFLIVNKLLIDNSLGSVVVNDENFDLFNRYLNEYYNDASKEQLLIDFLISNCIYNTLNKKLIR